MRHLLTNQSVVKGVQMEIHRYLVRLAAGPPGAVPIRPDHGTLPGWDLQSTDPMCEDVPAVSRESEWNAIKHYGVLV